MKFNKVIILEICIFLALINIGYSSIIQEWDHTISATSSGGFNHGATVNGVYYVTNAYGSHNFTGINISNGDVVGSVQINSGSGVTGQGAYSVPIFTSDYKFAWVYFGTSGGTDFAFTKVNLTDFSIITSVSGLDGTSLEEFAYDDTYFYNVEHLAIHKRRISDGVSVNSYAYTTSNDRIGGTLLVNNILYFRKQNGYFIAINTSDMTELWNVSLISASSYSYNAPSYDRETGYIYVGDGTSNAGNFYAINLVTHEIVWNNTGNSCSFSSMHATCNDMIVAPCYNSGGSGYYYAFDKVNGDILWQQSENTGWKAPVCDDTYLYNWRNAGTNDFNKRYLTNGTIADTLNVGTVSFCDSGNLVSNGTNYMYVGSGNGVRAFNLGSTTETNNTWQYKGNDEYYNANYDLILSSTNTDGFYIKIKINTVNNSVNSNFYNLFNGKTESINNENLINWNNLVWGY